MASAAFVFMESISTALVCVTSCNSSRRFFIVAARALTSYNSVCRRCRRRQWVSSKCPSVGLFIGRMSFCRTVYATWCFKLPSCGHTAHEIEPIVYVDQPLPICLTYQTRYDLHMSELREIAPRTKLRFCVLPALFRSWWRVTSAAMRLARPRPASRTLLGRAEGACWPPALRSWHIHGR